MLAERIGPAELLELAGRRAHREFSAEPGRMSRLAEMLVNDRAGSGEPLHARVEFRQGPDRFPELQVRLSGDLRLACQRCLGSVGHSVDLDFVLTVVASDAEAEQAPEPFDSIVMDADGISVSRIIEDEILADLPMAPMHDAADPDCRGSEALPAASSERSASRLSGANRPFADLAAMMAHDEKGRAD